MASATSNVSNAYCMKSEYDIVFQDMNTNKIKDFDVHSNDSSSRYMLPANFKFKMSDAHSDAGDEVSNTTLNTFDYNP